MLTNGDFYNQLKSTGFGDCETAARFLSAKFNFRFTDDQFSLFVDFVGFVRDAIRAKNVDNKLDGNQFEKQFKRWLEKPRDFNEPVTDGWEDRKDFDNEKRFLKIDAKDRLAFRRDDKTCVSENETSFAIKIETEQIDDFLTNVSAFERATEGRTNIFEISPTQRESEKPLLVDGRPLDETDNSALERLVSDTGTKMEYKHEVEELSISLDLADLDFFQRDGVSDVFDVKKERHETTRKTDTFDVIKSKKRKSGVDEIKAKKSRTTKKNKETKPKGNNSTMRESRRRKDDVGGVSGETNESLPYPRLDSELVPEKVRADLSEPRLKIREETEKMEKTELKDFPNSRRSDEKDGNDENVEESEDERQFLLECDPDSDDYYEPGEDTSEEEYHPRKCIGMRKTRAHTRALRVKKVLVDPVVTQRSPNSENIATSQNSQRQNMKVETVPIDFLEDCLGNDAVFNRDNVLENPFTSRLVDRSPNKAPRLRNISKRKVSSVLKRKKKVPKKKKGKKGKRGWSEPPDYDYVSEVSSGEEFSLDKPTLPQKRGRKRENPLLENEKDENNRYRCTAEGCPNSYSQNSTLVEHMRRKHELLLLECELCDKRFIDRALLSYHEDSEHNDGSGSFECSLCPTRFRSARNLAKHDLSTHDVSFDHTCDHCEELFAEKASKMDHIFASHPEDNVCCLICKKYFNNEKASVKHYKTSHDGEHVLKCEFCDKAFFVLRKSLTYHVELNHPDKSCWDKPLLCEILRCQLSFSTPENFSKHNQSRHNRNDDGESAVTKKPEMKKPKEMSVFEICGKSFVKDRFHFHLMAHDSSLEFECDRCEGRYGSSRALRKHKQTVHSSRRFKCSQCPAVFKRYWTLENHIGAVHERRKHSCNDCDKTYAFRCDLLGHINAVHKGRKSTCRYCKKSFLRSSERNRHEKSVHRDESDEELDDERDDELQDERDEQSDRNDEQNGERDDKFDDLQKDKN